MIAQMPSVHLPCSFSKDGWKLGYVESLAELFQADLLPLIWSLIPIPLCASPAFFSLARSLGQLPFSTYTCFLKLNLVRGFAVLYLATILILYDRSILILEIKSPPRGAHGVFLNLKKKKERVLFHKRKSIQSCFYKGLVIISGVTSCVIFLSFLKISAECKQCMLLPHTLII